MGIEGKQTETTQERGRRKRTETRREDITTTEHQRVSIGIFLDQATKPMQQAEERTLESWRKNNHTDANGCLLERQPGPTERPYEPRSSSDWLVTALNQVISVIELDECCRA